MSAKNATKKPAKSAARTKPTSSKSGKANSARRATVERPPLPEPPPLTPPPGAGAGQAAEGAQIRMEPASPVELSYSPELCQRVVTFGSAGLSPAGIAGALNVSFATLELWRGRYPEFSAALELAAARSAASWELRMIAVARSGKGSPAAVIFGAKNRGHGEWRDRVNVAVSGDKDAPPVKVDLTGLSDEQLDVLEKALSRVVEGEKK